MSILQQLANILKDTKKGKFPELQNPGSLKYFNVCNFSDCDKLTGLAISQEGSIIAIEA